MLPKSKIHSIATERPTMMATLWMVGSLFSFSTLAICARELSYELNLSEIIFLRNCISFLIICAILQKKGWGQIATKTFKLHLVRNLTHFAGQYGWLFGIAAIPLAEVFAIEFTVPIWTALWAAILLKEKITRYRFAAIALGIVGVLIIVRPGVALIHPATFAVLGTAISFGLVHITTKRLTPHNSSLNILFYMTLIQLPLSFGFALPNWTTPSDAMWPWLLLMGSAAMAGHYSLTQAFHYADATVVVPMDFLRLPLIALVGFIFYNEGLDWFVLLGALFMLGGNTINIRAEKK